MIRQIDMREIIFNERVENYVTCVETVDYVAEGTMRVIFWIC